MHVTQRLILRGKEDVSSILRKSVSIICRKLHAKPYSGLSRSTKSSCIEVARQMCIFCDSNADNFGPIFVKNLYDNINKEMHEYMDFFIYMRVNKEQYSPSGAKRINSTLINGLDIS